MGSATPFSHFTDEEHGASLPGVTGQQGRDSHPGSGAHALDGCATLPVPASTPLGWLVTEVALEAPGGGPD